MFIGSKNIHSMSIKYYKTYLPCYDKSPYWASTSSNLTRGENRGRIGDLIFSCKKTHKAVWLNMAALMWIEHKPIE